MTLTTSLSDGWVTLVTQTRIATGGDGAYAEWQDRVGEFLATKPGFLGQEVIPSSPPVQVDWVVVQKFRTREDARAWLQSEERRQLLNEVKSYSFVGPQGRTVLAFAFCRKFLQHSAMRLAGSAGYLPGLRLVVGAQIDALETARRLRVTVDPLCGLDGKLRLASLQTRLREVLSLPSKRCCPAPSRRKYLL